MPEPSPITLATGAFVGAAFASFMLTPLAAALAERLGAVDVPGGRRVHLRPTPRLGGVAIFGGLALGAGTYGFAFGWKALLSVLSADPLLAFLVPCLLIFLVGVIDDIRGLGPGPRLVLESIAAAFLIQAGYVIDNVTNPFGDPLSLGMFAYPLTMLWVVGVTNAFNLIDGLDGLLATVGAVTLTCCGVVAALSGRTGSATLAFALAGALVGFLPHNWHPARIFMGDSGSLVVGFTAAALSLKAATTAHGTLSFHVAVALCALPIAETSLTLARRYVNGHPYFSGDRSHIHHVLLNRGLSAPRAVLWLAGVTVLFCAVAVLSRYWRQGGVFAVIVALLGVAGLSLRYLGYIELRVFWDRVRHNLFRRRRRGLPQLLSMAQAGEALARAERVEHLPAALREAVRLSGVHEIRLVIPALPSLAELPAGEWIFTESDSQDEGVDRRLKIQLSLPLPPTTGELGTFHCYYSSAPELPPPAPLDVQRYLAWPLARALAKVLPRDQPARA